MTQGRSVVARRITLTLLALLAFAGNSLLCRAALRDTVIDAATFTTLRLVSGGLTLGFIAHLRRRPAVSAGTWLSAFTLFAYAAGFSFAYESLSAATGALLLFGAVQATMIGYGLWARERLGAFQVVGFLLAFAGLLSFLLPGLTAPPLSGALLMLGAGVAWGIYSLRGRKAGDPVGVTAGNFLRAAPFAILVSLLTVTQASLDTAGFWYAIASGALTSGIGYVIWYAVLPSITATAAAGVQLGVPVIAAFGGVLLLGESVSLRLAIASVVILGGIALTIATRRQSRASAMQ